MGRKKKVLFICTGNSCRSQMAEGLLRNLAGNRFLVYSAGTHPSRVHPMSIAVMAEVGIDISNNSSDPIEKYINTGIDIVITVCDNANQSCPTFPGDVERLHWSIDDPFRNWDFNPAHLTPHRDTREILKKYIKQFLKNH
ncbi:MAG: arsenate reductase ArsC [Fidelibacterota bacterium]